MYNTVNETETDPVKLVSCEIVWSQPSAHSVRRSRRRRCWTKDEKQTSSFNTRFLGTASHSMNKLQLSVTSTGCRLEKNNLHGGRYFPMNDGFAEKVVEHKGSQYSDVWIVLGVLSKKVFLGLLWELFQKYLYFLAKTKELKERIQCRKCTK